MLSGFSLSDGYRFPNPIHILRSANVGLLNGKMAYFLPIGPNCGFFLEKD
jgi:hypothetical protein